MRKRWRLLAAAGAFVIASSSSTAVADPRAAPIIPGHDSKFADQAPKSEVATLDAASSELPPPYDPWQGTGFGPPTAHPALDAPPPLARPREHTRRPLEVSASLAAFLPSCGTGSIDDHGCQTVAAGSGVDVALLYRAGPFFAVGVEGVVSELSRGGHGFVSGAGGGGRFFGVVGRVYFAADGPWDPYVALTLGAGMLDLRGADAERASTSGFGGRAAFGIDYSVGSHFRIGPTASFAHWLAWSEQQCTDDLCRSEPAAYGRLLGFATLGLRVTGSFGDGL